MIGRVLEGEDGGRYEVGPLLAVGGQGAVHLGRDARDGREVVLKVALVPGAAGRAGLERQAALAADPVVGAHVVPVWDLGWVGDRGFGVLERMEETLEAHVGRGAPADPVARALLAVWATFERAGVVHGDLKPSNVFVRPGDDGPVVLVADPWAGVGATPISPGFAAPECWAGAAPSLASDRYALGATLAAAFAPGAPAEDARLPPGWDVAGRLLAAAPAARPTVAGVRASLDAPSRRPRRPLAILALLALSAAEPARPCPAPFVREGTVCAAPDGRRVAWLPPGRFVAGARTAEEREWSVDAPAHAVRLTHGLWVRTTEVRQAEHRALLGWNPVEDGIERLPTGATVPCARWEGHDTVGDELPLACITFPDAARLANAASAADGLRPAYALVPGPDGRTEVRWDATSPGWRLPTEAEWEWAARAADLGGPWAGAAARDTICTHANPRDADAPESWGREVPCRDGAPVLAPVGRYAPNAVGLHDVLGNVAEWVWDRYGDLGARPLVDPRGAEAGPLRVFRGGGWNQIARPVSARYGGDPDEAGLNVGVRLVRDAD